MKNELLQRIADAAASHIPLWVATVVTADGSTPADIGLKMIVYIDGSTFGTVGGGSIEKMVIEKIAVEHPVTVEKWRFDLGANQEVSIRTGMVCGGIQEILIEPIAQGTPLVIIGGGHCGVALSAMAARTGFSVTVVDDRAEWANKEKHPHAARLICTDLENLSPQISMSDQSFVVIMTHGHRYDEAVLKQIIRQQVKYIGMIGSDNKVKLVLERLGQEGIPNERLSTIFAPIGFPIGSHSPEEVAVAIMAQMIAVKYGRGTIVFNSNPLLKG
jgi:xanthine dehydrogenase accessory factor